MFLWPSLLLEKSWPIFFVLIKLFGHINFFSLKRKPSQCSILIYSSSDLSESVEENFNSSVIYVINFFRLQCISTLLKSLTDNIFYILSEQNQLILPTNKFN